MEGAKTSIPTAVRDVHFKQWREPRSPYQQLYEMCTVAIWKLIPTTEVPSEEVAHGVWCDEITWLIIVSISLEYVQTYSAMTVKYAQCLFCKYSAEYHVL